MGSARICLDLDNVLAKTDEVMRCVIREFTGGRVAFPYEDIVDFNYWKCRDAEDCRISKDEWKQIHEAFSQPEHILEIEPYEGIQTHLARIAEVLELHIVTSRLRRARRATVEWLDIHGFPDHFLHFVQHGEKHTVLGEFAVSVEDHLEQAEAFAAERTRSYLLAHPWNVLRAESAVVRVADWETLQEDLLVSWHDRRTA